MKHGSRSEIVYTWTDESPAMATLSLLPIIRFFLKAAGVLVTEKDISLAGRILSQCSDCLPPEKRLSSALEELGQLVQNERANIIKLPNISASLPQLKEALLELQDKGYELPPYSDQPERYGKVLGSAVNPVLREGNSDRRVAAAVKKRAKARPHSLGEWTPQNRSHVASMERGDFYSTERSCTLSEATCAKLEWTGQSGEKICFKEGVSLSSGEIIDGAVMNIRSLREYYRKEMADAKEKGLLLSLHLKATMMKISDPIIFGHGVEMYYEDIFQRYGEDFKQWGIDPRSGLAQMETKLEKEESSCDDGAKKKEVVQALRQIRKERPSLAMVDSDKGITNLHLPNHIIIDASMPAMIKNSGRMWNPQGVLQETKALIPDGCYGGIYQRVMDFCREHGAFNVATMGSVSNVGLMAKKAEEYGSHDKTFEMPGDGVMRVLEPQGEVLLEHSVEKGDIWRMCQTKKEAVLDWVKLAVNRVRKSGVPGVFWLDPNRAHDREIKNLVEHCLKDHSAQKLTLFIMNPLEAMSYTLERMARGEDTISITGNVLRDYLTDLFPILELGTSAKMLSLVPLLKGGGLYETGAGGSAPLLAQQLLKENHLRWNSLGEFLAMAVSLEDLAAKEGGRQIEDLAESLHRANEDFLERGKEPSSKVFEQDTRESHFYLALYWAERLSEFARDKALKEHFAKVYGKLCEGEDVIVKQFRAIQGRPVDLGGYYLFDRKKAEVVMRPCELFNNIISS